MRYTAPQLQLLQELTLRPQVDLKLAKKSGLNNERVKLAQYPSRSGNFETPVKNKHKKLMGQPENPHGTRADKLGRESSEASVHAVPTTQDDPTGLRNMGQPYQRGVLNNPASDDDAEKHPNKSTKPQRLQGPSETPGKQTYTGFGNRYPGVRNV